MKSEKEQNCPGYGKIFKTYDKRNFYLKNILKISVQYRISEWWKSWQCEITKNLSSFVKNKVKTFKDNISITPFLLSLLCSYSLQVPKKWGKNKWHFFWSIWVFEASKQIYITSSSPTQPHWWSGMLKQLRPISEYQSPVLHSWGTQW